VNLQNLFQDARRKSAAGCSSAGGAFEQSANDAGDFSPATGTSSLAAEAKDERSDLAPEERLQAREKRPNQKRHRDSGQVNSS